MNWIPAFAGITDEYWIPDCAVITAVCVQSSAAISFSAKPDTSNILYSQCPVIEAAGVQERFASLKEGRRYPLHDDEPTGFHGRINQVAGNE